MLHDSQLGLCEDLGLCIVLCNELGMKSSRAGPRPLINTSPPICFPVHHQTTHTHTHTHTHTQYFETDVYKALVFKGFYCKRTAVSQCWKRRGWRGLPHAHTHTNAYIHMHTHASPRWNVWKKHCGILRVFVGCMAAWLSVQTGSGR